MQSTLAKDGALLPQRRSLILRSIACTNEREGQSSNWVKDTPNLWDDDDLTPAYENRIRRHFGLESMEPSTTHGSYSRRGVLLAGLPKAMPQWA